MSLLLVVAICACACATTVHAARTGVPPLIFPVVGTVTYQDDFGDPRGALRHEGNDLIADKRAPAVAVEAGTVKYWTTSASAGCMLYLYGASGTMYEYIHLNNDLTALNDNKGTCVKGTAYAVADGAHVEPGSRSGTSVTRAMRTASIRTSISKSTREGRPPPIRSRL